jgi:hypothetical protein
VRACSLEIVPPSLFVVWTLRYGLGTVTYQRMVCGTMDFGVREVGWEKTPVRLLRVRPGLQQTGSMLVELLQGKCET